MAVTRESAIERLAGLQPGRRGFGGSADPAEAAAFRHAIRGDHDLNPGVTPPSTALTPAAGRGPATWRRSRPTATAPLAFAWPRRRCLPSS